MIKIKGSHWKSLVGVFDPANYEGFIYFVTNKDGSKQYIGKKNFHSIRREKIKGRKNRKIHKNPSDWLKYQSSSAYLKEDIAILGLDAFDFFIVDLYKTKGGLHSAECYYQHMFQVLTKTNIEGEKQFYNRQIAGIKFIPKESISESSRQKISDAQKLRWTPEARAKQSEKVSGKLNGMYGKTHTTSARKKISEARTETKHTKETISKIKKNSSGVSNGMYGKTHTKQVRNILKTINCKTQYYCGEYGKFISTVDAAKVIGCSPSTVSKRCNNSESIIRSNRAMKGAKGKTWRDLGWYSEELIKQEIK